MFDFPFDVVAVISTVPDFFAITSPVESIVAILSSLDFHVIFLSVALLGVIIAVNFSLSPTSIFSTFLSICISLTAILVGIDVVVLVAEELELEPEPELEPDVLLLPDDEYGQTPFGCKCAGCPPQW